VTVKRLNSMVYYGLELIPMEPWMSNLDFKLYRTSPKSIIGLKQIPAACFYPYTDIKLDNFITQISDESFCEKFRNNFITIAVDGKSYTIPRLHAMQILYACDFGPFFEKKLFSEGLGVKASLCHDDILNFCNYLINNTYACLYYENNNNYKYYTWLLDNIVLYYAIKIAGVYESEHMFITKVKLDMELLKNRIIEKDPFLLKHFVNYKTNMDAIRNLEKSIFNLVRDSWFIFFINNPSIKNSKSLKYICLVLLLVTDFKSVTEKLKLAWGNFPYSDPKTIVKFHWSFVCSLISYGYSIIFDNGSLAWII
jgi:hypothetical protein